MTAIAEQSSTTIEQHASPSPALRIVAAVVHALDYRGRGLQLTDALVTLTERVVELLAGYMVKALGSPQARLAKFESGEVRDGAFSVLEGSTDLLELSRSLAERLFRAMESTGASDGDVAFVHAVDNSTDQPLLAILKLDLQHGFRREFETGQGRSIVRITPIGDLMPDPERRLQKCAFIPGPPHSLPYDLVVLDNQSGNEGRGPAAFFTSDFLRCQLVDGAKELTRKLVRETEQWLRDEELSPAVALEAREAVIQAVNEPEVDLDHLASSTFSDPAQRERYRDHLESAGFESGRFTTDRSVADRLTSNLTYVLDGGVRISGDAETIAALLHVDPEPTGDGKVRVVIESARFERRY